MSLRVRREGGRWIQTLKGPDTARGGLLRRLEIEAPVPRPVPQLDRFDPDAVGALLTEVERAGPWVETVHVQVRRTRQAVRLFDSDIVLAFDSGVVEAGGHTAPISELELELVTGRPDRLYELAIALSEAVPFRIERRSKLQQGLALRRGMMQPEPVRAAPVTIEPGSDPARVFTDTVGACLAHLQANELPAADGDDPEGVHQARVAIRRLRALVGLYRATMRPDVLNSLRTELRWLQGALGPAREWDVFLTETLTPLDEAFPGEPGLAALRRAAEAERRAAYRTVTETLHDTRYLRLELQTALWLESREWLNPDAAARFAEPGSLETFAGDVLERAYHKLRKAGRRHEGLDSAGLHRVRILAKKLRYAGEFFESLYPRKPTRRFLKRLAGIQEALGSMNDAAVAQHLLGVLTARLEAEGADGPMVATGCGLVRGWQAAVVATDRSHFDGLWRRWRQAERFWTTD